MYHTSMKSLFVMGVLFCVLHIVFADPEAGAVTESKTRDVEEKNDEFDELETDMDDKEPDDYIGCALTGGTCRRRYDKTCTRIYEPPCTAYCCSYGTCCPGSRRRFW